MYSAIDNNNQIITINEAINGQLYFCPICKNKVFVKKGTMEKAAHFCHYPNQSCTDYWKYDKTIWSNKWKSNFENDEIEKVYGEHRVDIVVKNNLGIMFCSHNMHRDLFIEKTNYVLSYLNNAMWLVNLTELYNNKIIFPHEITIDWKKMWSIFSNYQFVNKKVWIVVEIKVENISWFGILKDINLSYNSKKFYVLRWLKKDAFIKYFNDLASKRDPEAFYINVDIEKTAKIKVEKKDTNDTKETAQIVNKQNSQAGIVEEGIKSQNKPQMHINDIEGIYKNNPEMKRMSDELSRLEKEEKYIEFADLALKWKQRYGFPWIYSDFYH